VARHESDAPARRQRPSSIATGAGTTGGASACGLFGVVRNSRALCLCCMPERTTRVNQLLLREFSEELHTRWRAESVRVTLTGVSISPDLRDAVVSFSVLGDIEERRQASRFLRRIAQALKTQVFQRVKIKYTPALRFVYDEAPERGSHLINVMDAVAREDAQRAERHEPAPPPVAEFAPEFAPETEPDSPTPSASETPLPVPPVPTT
jgi:ribosome-binding factor A